MRRRRAVIDLRPPADVAVPAPPARPASPPPPPPSPRAGRQNRTRIRPRRRSGDRWGRRRPLLELAVAVMALAGLSAAFAGRPPAAPSPLGLWAERASPVVGAVLSDGSALAPGGGSSARSAGALQADLAAARRLAPPPDPTLRAEWARALASLARSVAGTGATPSGGAAATSGPDRAPGIDRSALSAAVLGLSAVEEAARTGRPSALGPPG